MSACGREIQGYYGGLEYHGNPVTTIFEYEGWYVIDGSVNVNRTDPCTVDETLVDGVNVDWDIEDIDVFTMSEPIESLQELIDAVDSHE